MSKELEALNDLIDFIGNGEIADTHELCEYVAKRKDIIETALKRNIELEKIEYKQNTINDFYPNTKVMIDDLLDLVCTKLCDFLKEGRTYTRTGVLETLGFAIRYVKTFAFGEEFNENEKIGVNAKKLKALEIIKTKKVDVDLLDTIMKDENQIDKLWSYNFWQLDKYKLTQEEYDLLKEVLL